MSKFRSISFIVHRWIGVSASLFLIVIFLSGAVLTFGKELDWLFKPAMRVEAQSSALEWQKMVEMVRQAYPKGRIINILAPHRPNYAAIAEVRFPNSSVKRVFVNPYSGEVRGDEYRLQSIHRVVREFHRTLFYYPMGTFFVTLLSIPLALSLITGLIHYRDWWKGLFLLRLGTPKARGDLHRLLGLWSLWFMLIMVVTGLWYFAENYMLRYGIRPSEAVYPSYPQEQMQQYQSAGNELSIDQMLYIAEKAFPEMEVRAIMSPSPAKPTFIGGQADSVLTRDRGNYLMINPYTGEIDELQRVSELRGIDRWAESSDPIHYGDGFGLISQFIWAFFSLVVVALMVLGLQVASKRQQVDGYRKPGLFKTTGIWGGLSALILALAIAAGIYAGMHTHESTMSPLYKTNEYGSSQKG